MYLGELNGPWGMAPGATSGIIGADESSCRAAGGVFVDADTANRMYGSYGARCFIPGQSSQAPAQPVSVSPTINVSPAIQTQVSPQVSPVFVQQDQPTGSPVTAGTSQQMPTSQGAQSGGTSNDAALMREFLAAQARQQEQYAQMVREALAAQRQAQPVYQPVYQPAPQPVPVSAPSGPSPEELLRSYQQVVVPKGEGEAVQPVSSQKTGIDKRIAWALAIAGAGILVYVMANNRKRK